MATKKTTPPPSPVCAGCGSVACGTPRVPVCCEACTHKT